MVETRKRGVKATPQGIKEKKDRQKLKRSL